MTKLEIKEVKTSKGTDAIQFISYINDKPVSVVIDRSVIESMDAMTFCKEILKPGFSLAAKTYAGIQGE